MEEIISQVRRGCELSRKLEADLHDQNYSNPNHLLASSQDVVNAFGKAIQALHFACGDLPPSGSDADISKVMQATNPLQVTASAEDVGVLFMASHWPDAATMSSAGMLELASGSMYNTSARDTPGAAFVGGSPLHHAAESAAALSEARRSEAGLSVQRLQRKRKDSSGNCTIRVPATHPENIDIPPDDGYTWRKYGQKVILGCKHHRSYYRCTHKNFGCEAKKKVQRLNEDPNTYEVTYCGVHCCRTSPTQILQFPHLQPPNAAGEWDNAEVPPSLPATQPFHAVSTAMDLHRVLLMDHFDAMQSAGGSSSQAQGGRSDMDFPVIDLADSMFNSGSSGSSMDAIFPSGQEHWRGDKQQ